MSQAPFMPLFCGTYLADTMHLTNEESGCYLKLLMVTWCNNGKPLADDDVRMARTLAITVDRWRTKIRPRLVEFFDISEGTWLQKRLTKEWDFVQKRAAKSRDNGARGGRPKPLKRNETQNPAGSSQVTQTEPTYTYTYKNPPKPPRGRGGEDSLGVVKEGELARPLADSEKFRKWLKDWRPGRLWPRDVLGPPPNERGCNVPARLLREFGHEHLAGEIAGNGTPEPAGAIWRGSGIMALPTVQCPSGVAQNRFAGHSNAGR